MNCRNCGAAMEPVGGRAYFRCPHCRSFEFPTTNDDGVAAHGEATELPCPFCNSPLTKASIEGHSICYCGTCRGFLTTNAAFAEILERRRAHCADQPSIPQSLDRGELTRRIGCPKCRKTMDTHPFGGGGNVVVDSCNRCQLIWLDAGELEILARHRPKMSAIVQPAAPAPSQVSELGLHWGGSNYDEYGSNGPSMWELLSRLM